MNKDMNELGVKVIKYDLMMGLFISVFIGVILSFNLAVIYYYGVVISVVNYELSKYLIKRWSITGNAIVLILSSFGRVLTVVALAAPFIYSLGTILSYTLGFSSHFMFLMIYCLTNKEGK